MHTKNTHTATSPAQSKRGWALLGVLLVAQLMVILDITAVNIALPSVAADMSSAARRSAG